MSGLSQDDIIRMAREAGFELTMWQISFGYETCGTHEELERFANLVAAAEREACAKVCESAGPGAGPIYCAFAIRARAKHAS